MTDTWRVKRCIIINNNKANFLSKLIQAYSNDNMLFKLFVKNIQNELLLIRCY